MEKDGDAIELEIRQQVVYLTERRRVLRAELAAIEDELPRLEEVARILAGQTRRAAPERASAPAKRRGAAKAGAGAAPYGYKADGTPYKRRPPKAGDRRRLSRSEQQRTRAAGEATLRVVSSLHPTKTELAGRELVHATEQPA